MLYDAENGNIKIGETDMDYVVFGKGEEPLVLIPGLSDGLTTVKGKAAALAWYYREFTGKFRVYVFSRKKDLTEGYSTRDMAKDQMAAMDKLGISRAMLMGVSQGGMIAQYMAIDYPEVVKRLVIGVSVSKPNSTIAESVGSWIRMAEKGDYKSLIIDTIERTYSEQKLKTYRPLFPLISKIGRPKSFNRFLIQARACLSHNAYAELDKIKAPTLVIGGDSDKVVGTNTSEEIAERIGNSVLVVYNGLGHGAYEEAKDFNRRVMDFLLG